MEFTLMEKYEFIKKVLRKENEKNPIQIAKKIMKSEFISLHGPEHHFLDGACLIVAYKNAGGKIDVEKALNLFAERTIKMPGAMCGFWGVCGSTTSIGAALSIIHDVGPLSSSTYYKDDMEFTSKVLDKMSKIGGPRCCKRNAFLSLDMAIDFIKEKYNIAMEKENQSCEFSQLNQQCIGTKCPFYQANRHHFIENNPKK